MDLRDLGELVGLVESEIDSCTNYLLNGENEGQRDALEIFKKNVQIWKNSTEVYEKMAKNSFDRISDKIQSVENALRKRMHHAFPRVIPIDDNVVVDCSDSGDEQLNPFLLDLVDDPRENDPYTRHATMMLETISSYTTASHEIRSPSVLSESTSILNDTPSNINAMTAVYPFNLDPRLDPTRKTDIYQMACAEEAPPILSEISTERIVQDEAVQSTQCKKRKTSELDRLQGDSDSPFFKSICNVNRAKRKQKASLEIKPCIVVLKRCDQRVRHSL